VEYSVKDPDYTDEFIEVADAVEEEFPELAVVGNEGASMAADVPRQGAFEVHFDGRTLFSALQQKRLPETDELLAKILQAKGPSAAA